MATEFNYVVNVDTTRVMGAMAEVRSQMGMAFGGPGAGMGPGVAPAEPSAFGGAASRAWGMMQSGLARGVGRLGGIGRTFTDERIAYDPHYGMIQAETNLQQEWQVQRFGLQAAARMRPPGVSAFDYAMNVQRNAVDRRIEANYQAFAAGRSTLLSGAAGLGAGELAYVAAGAPIGAAVGGRLATRWGLGAGAGRMVGGVLGGLGAFMLAEQYVGGKIRGHYAEVAQTRGIMTELGDIAGAGRGLSRVEQVRLGVSAYKAAKDIGIDANQMGDVIALGRQAGLLPETTDPAKARQQFGEFAKAIDEGAQMLRTSLANATQVIKHMAGRGYGAEEGILQFIGEQATPGLAQMRAFGAEGTGVARANFLRGQQGFNLFTAGVRQAAGAGMDPEVLGMMGGKFGAGRMIAMTQMQAALSPMGDLQLMAAQGGAPLGGLYETGAAALGVAAEGGDLIGNMIRFENTKDQIRRGIGAKGIRTMAMQQVQGVAKMLMNASPSLTMEDARVAGARNLFQMTGDQARMFVSGGVAGGGPGGAGGISGYGRAAQLEAYQRMQLGRAGMFELNREGIEVPDSGFSLKYTKYGGAGGLAVGYLAGPGAIAGGAIGAAGGFIGDVGSFLSRNWDYIGKGPGLFSSAEAKAEYEAEQMAKKHDESMAAIRRDYGETPINIDVAARAATAPLRSAQLNLDLPGPEAASRMMNVVEMAGLRPTVEGPGTVTLGGKVYKTAEVREASKWLSEAPEITEEVERLAYDISITGYEKVAAAGYDVRRTYRFAAEQLAKGGGAMLPEQRTHFMTQYHESAAAMIGASGDEKLRELYAQRGAAHPKIRAVLQRVAGGTTWQHPKMAADMEQEISFQSGMAAEEKQYQKYLEGWLVKAAGGGYAEREKMAGALAEDPGFRKAIAAGKWEDVEKVVRRRALDFPDIAKQGGPEAIMRGLKEKRARLDIVPDPEMKAAAETWEKEYAEYKKDYAGAFPGIDLFMEERDRAIKAATGKVDVMQEFRRLVRGVKDLGTTVESKPAGRRRRRRRRRRMTERAVGFGQREQAMTTINRALKSTYRQLKNHERRISKTPTTESANPAKSGVEG